MSWAQEFAPRPGGSGTRAIPRGHENRHVLAADFRRDQAAPLASAAASGLADQRDVLRIVTMTAGWRAGDRNEIWIAGREQRLIGRKRQSR